MFRRVPFSLLLLAAASQALLQAQEPLMTAEQRYFSSVRRNLEASADAMPADKYSYKLTPGQMSFAEWLNHASQRNFADCAVMKSESAPPAAAKVTSLTDKAEVSQALKDSFAYCADALKTFDDKKAVSSPEIANAFLHIVVHNNEIYGNIVGYMRSSGIVPPSTAARGGQKTKKN
jgi:hypothetical protein